MVRKLEMFSVRDLRLRSSDLVREAEAGQVSVITKRGRPAVVAVPFGTRLVDRGLDKDLALALFEQGLITMAKAAKLAGVTQDVFMDLMAEAGSVAVDYPAEELTDELSIRIRSRRSSPPRRWGGCVEFHGGDRDGVRAWSVGSRPRAVGMRRWRSSKNIWRVSSGATAITTA